MIQGFIPQQNSITNPLLSPLPLSLSPNLVPSIPSLAQSLPPQSSPLPSPLLTKTKLKRKRFVKDWPNTYNNENNSYYDDLNSKNDDSDNDDDNADVESSHSNLANAASDSGSNHSTGSSSANSFVMKKCKIRHGHKMLITEESKMSEALKDLQIEIDNIESEPPAVLSSSSNASRAVEPAFKHHDVAFDNEDADDENDTTTSGILISNELKKKLSEFKYKNILMATSDDLRGRSAFNPYFDTSNNMQLVVWAPPAPLPCPDDAAAESEEQTTEDEVNTSINSNSSTLPDMSEMTSSSVASLYKVEEPTDSATSKKNRLKRKFSQLNKIQIEEMQQQPLNTQPLNAAQLKSQQLPSATFYLIDYEDEIAKDTDSAKDSANKDTPVDSSGVKIVDVTITEAETVKPLPQNSSEETMDLN
jgi:hypothetical protein